MSSKMTSRPGMGPCQRGLRRLLPTRPCASASIASTASAVDLRPQHVHRVAVVVELALGPVSAHVAEVVTFDPLARGSRGSSGRCRRARSRPHAGRRVNGDGVLPSTVSPGCRRPRRARRSWPSVSCARTRWRPPSRCSRTDRAAAASRPQPGSVSRGTCRAPPCPRRSPRRRCRPAQGPAWRSPALPRSRTPSRGCRPSRRDRARRPPSAARRRPCH